MKSTFIPNWSPTRLWHLCPIYDTEHLDACNSMVFDPEVELGRIARGESVAESSEALRDMALSLFEPKFRLLPPDPWWRINHDTKLHREHSRR